MPHGSLGKGSGTPKNLARSHVLVAKVLTNSDTHGRIILPRVSVEANLTFLMGYRCHLQPITFAISCIFQLSFALTCSASRFRLPVHLHVSAHESLLHLTQGRQCLAVAHLQLLLHAWGQQLSIKAASEPVTAHFPAEFAVFFRPVPLGS